MPAPLVTVEPGEMYAVPLFVSAEPVNTRFARAAFDGRGDEFAYLRIIEDRRGAGILVEVFSTVGPLDASASDAVAGGRLFRPVAVGGLGIHKQRWRRIGATTDYDRERDSAYSQIQLALGLRDAPRLWQAGVETPLSVTEAAAYERWIVWTCADLEKRIIDELAALPR